MSTKVEVMEEALLDQRIRSDKHRENFEALKAVFINLQENHENMQHRYAVLSEQFDQLHAKSQEIITTLQHERDTKIVECEELKPQVLTAQKLEQLRQQWSEELEQQFRKRVESAETNLEAVRREYNKLVNSYTFLKSEYESAKVTHDSVLQEMKAKYDSEVSLYAEKLRLAHREHDMSSNVHEIRQLQRVNDELQQRVSSLEVELEEVQKERDKVYLQAEQCFQQHFEQSSSTQVHMRTLEMERSSLASQVESLQSELSSSHDKQVELQALVDKAHRETSKLHRQLEKAEAKYAAQISNAKMQGVHECQKLEAAQERVLADQLAYQTQLDLLQRTVREHEALLVNKEQEIEQRIQAAREKEWEKVMVLQKEKIELEERLAERQRIQTERDEENKCNHAKLEEQLKVLDTQKRALQSEIRSLQAELQTKADQQHTTQLDLQRALHYKKKQQNLFAQYQSLQQREQELHGKCSELQSTIHLLEETVDRAQGELLCLTEVHQKTLHKERKLWSEERSQLQGRLEEVETQVRQLTKQLNAARRTSNKLQNYYKKQVQDLNQSLELQKRKEDQMTAEKEALKQSMDLDNKRLRNKLAEFQRKQDKFLLLLHSDPCSTTGAENHTTVQMQYLGQRLDLDHRLHMTQLPSPTQSLGTLSNRDL